MPESGEGLNGLRRSCFYSKKLVEDWSAFTLDKLTTIDYNVFIVSKQTQTSERMTEMTEQAKSLKAEVDSRIENLVALTSDAARSEAMQKYLQTCAKFHHYSFLNQLIIAFTRPDATKVAGYKKWQQLKRQVRKGEKGIAILAPIIVKKIEDGIEKSVLVGFRTVYVFDISQTDGEELPGAPEWISPEKSAELHDKLLALCEKKSIRVEVADLPGEVQGVSKGGTIVLAPQAGTKTFVHELAHELLHHTKTVPVTREEAEVEAEAVAYVVASHFGLPGLNSANYLAIWASDANVISQRMDRIREASVEIIKAVEGHVKSEE